MIAKIKLLNNNKENYWKIAAVVILLVYCSIYIDLITGTKSFSGDAIVWYGTFHYYITQMQQGIFPYWDPYSLTGTYFYPNIAGYGLLDPFCLVCAAVSRVSDIHPLFLFTLFRLYRIFVFVGGAFLLFRHLSRNNIASIASAGILLFAATVQNYRQPTMDYCFTVPVALYFILLFLDNIENSTRYRYLLYLTLITGITMNVFIPALYLFNVVFFLILLLAFRCYSFKRVSAAFRDRKMISAAVLCIVLTSMMSAPSFAVFLKDTAGDGELFAISKLVDSNNYNFKKMMASQLGGDVFFDKLRKDQGAFLSVGSLISLLYPDMKGLNFRAGAENSVVYSLYIGIIPLLVIAAGLLYRRNKMAAPLMVMMLLVFVIAFSVEGVTATYNPAQKFLNAVFPPLRMLDTRIDFSSLITFYLCALFCLAAANLAEKDFAAFFPSGKYAAMIVICSVPIAAKLLITYYYAEGSFSLSPFDTAELLIPFSVIAALAAMRYRKTWTKAAMYALLCLAVADPAVTSTKTAGYMSTGINLRNFLDNADKYRESSISEEMRAYDGTEVFRLPFVPPQISPVPAFIESMLETKGSILSNSFISIFTTKRYYDLFSMLLPEKHMAVDGVIYPILRFFPLDRVSRAGSQAELIEYFQRTDIQSLGERLFVEPAESLAPRQTREMDLNAFQDLDWFNTDLISRTLQDIMPYMEAVRQKAGSFFKTADFRIRVSRFTVNDIILAVENKIPGYLQYNDGWSRYWKAYDGEKEIPIVIANYNSKAVFLAPGTHSIHFVFDPRHYKIALLLYYIALVITAAGIFLLTKAQKKRPGNAGPLSSLH